MKKELYRHLLENEKDELEFDEIIARIESLRAQTSKDWKTSAWLPLATLSPVLAAICVSIGYVLAKLP